MVGKICVKSCRIYIIQYTLQLYILQIVLIVTYLCFLHLQEIYKLQLHNILKLGIQIQCRLVFSTKAIYFLLQAESLCVLDMYSNQRRNAAAVFVDITISMFIYFI